MENKKSLGFGARGWVLIIVMFFGFAQFSVFTSYPLNILSDFYGGAQRVALVYTIGTLIGMVLQIILSQFVGKIKSIKKIASIIGIFGIIFSIGVALIPFTSLGLWTACYLLLNITVTLYALFFLSILAGQWFPTRKGTVMGVATISYPVVNGLLGFFATAVLSPLAMGQGPAIFKGFLPFLIASAVGYVLFVIFITDYPEQCGAYRDNNKNMTPEVAKKMLEEEIENKRTTVWTIGHTLADRDFWFATISCGMIAMGAIGALTQSQTIISAFPSLNYTVIMLFVALFGAIGSWLLGILDTRFGTKKSIIICTILMILAGIFGVIATATGVGALMVISMMLIAMFMGASSNYTVSVAAQYWRREDFSSVYGVLNPVANIFNAIAPTVVAWLLATALGIQAVFIFVTVIGVIGTILMILFSGAHVKKVDDKYRQAAGKPLDDALVGRK